MTIGQDRAAVEAAPEKVSSEFMAPVYVPREAFVNALDAGTQVGARRVHQEVDVVRHETECEDAPVPLPNLPCDKPQIASPVSVVVKEDSARGTFRSHVVNAPGEFDARLSWHAATSPATVWIRPMAQKGQSL
jgi:hypothetical protein